MISDMPISNDSVRRFVDI